MSFSLRGTPTLTLPRKRGRGREGASCHFSSPQIIDAGY